MRGVLRILCILIVVAVVTATFIIPSGKPDPEPDTSLFGGVAYAAAAVGVIATGAALWFNPVTATAATAYYLGGYIPLAIKLGSTFFGVTTTVTTVSGSIAAAGAAGSVALGSAVTLAVNLVQRMSALTQSNTEVAVAAKRNLYLFVGVIFAVILATVWLARRRAGRFMHLGPPIRDARALVFGISRSDGRHNVDLSVANDYGNVQSYYLARGCAISADSAQLDRLSKEKVLLRLRKFFNDQANCTLELVVYYAGHGAKGTGDWLVDQAQSITFDDVWNAWEASIARLRRAHLTMHLDTCSSGAWVNLARERKLDVTIQSSVRCDQAAPDGLFSGVWIAWLCSPVRTTRLALEELARWEARPTAYTSKTTGLAFPLLT